MANIGYLNAKMGIDIGDFAKGLSSSIAGGRNWAKEIQRVTESVMTPMERYRRELSKLNIMRAAGLDATTYARAIARVRAEYQGLIPVLSTAPGMIGRVRAQMNATAGRMFGGIGGNLRGLATMATGGGVIYGSIRAASGAEQQLKAERTLQATLQATGGAAGYTAAELKLYASELQNATNFADDATISAMAIAASFPQIGKANFKETIALAQDLATVMDTDLTSATKVLAKAMADPVRGMTQLRRYGIIVSEAEGKRIKQLVEQNNLLGAQNILRDAARGKVGGAAAAAASPMTQLKNTISDIGDEIGIGILPFFKLLKEEILSMKAAGEQTGAAMQTSLGPVGNILGVIADTVDFVADAFRYLQYAAAKFVQLLAKGFVLMTYVKPGMAGLREYANAFAAEMGIQSEELLKNANENFIARTPSERAQEIARKLASALGPGAAAQNIDEDALDAANATDKLGGMLQEINDEIAGVGLEKIDLLRMKAEKLFAAGDKTEADKKALDLLKERINDLGRVLKLQEDINRAKEIEKGVRTPREKLIDEAREMQRMMGAVDGFTAETAGKHLAPMLADIARGATGSFEGLAPALMAGSAEAYNFLHRESRDDVQKQMNQNLLGILAAAGTSNELLTAIGVALGELEQVGMP